jgi:hypothetical protein
VDAKFIIGDYETEHKFQVVGDMLYDGILGKDFFEEKINYMRKEIILGKFVLKFDKERQPERSNKEVRVILKQM